MLLSSPQRCPGSAAVEISLKTRHAIERISQTRELLNNLQHSKYATHIPVNFTSFPHTLKYEFIKQLLSKNGKCAHPRNASADLELAIQCMLTQWAEILTSPASGYDQYNFDKILLNVQFFYFFISSWIKNQTN